MAKIRLQIELDEKAYKCICGDGITLFNTGMRCGKTLFSQILVAIRNGTPMQNCNNCIERNKAFFIKWINHKMLDEIRADVEEQVVPRSIYTDKQKKQILEIIDKYRGKQNE